MSGGGDEDEIVIGREELALAESARRHGDLGHEWGLSRLTSGEDEQQNGEDAEYRRGRHLGWGIADAGVGGDRPDHREDDDDGAEEGDSEDEREDRSNS